ncbi:hypothetical protein ACLNCS_08325 [Streptococcus sp. CL9.43]|jgi:hypothetical protein|uniref:hypothetical protein n=1 Tax=Streptococcus sp. CL9.43 TaxID=3392238 RepID=UPI003C7DB2B9
MNQEKISSYIVGFLVIFALLFGLFAYFAISSGNQEYAQDTERVTKLVEALENDTTNIKPNITLEEALKLVSDDSELSSVKKEVKYLEDRYPNDHEYKISSLSSRVNKVELKLNQQIKDIKEEKERENQAKSSEEADKNSKESEKKSTEENKKVDLDAFYNAIQEALDKVNTQSGANMLEMEKTSVTPGIKIILTENNASYSNKELRAIISALNKSLYKIAKSHGVNSPRFYYTLSDEEVAVNRYVMAPDEVKFSGILK